LDLEAKIQIVRKASRGLLSIQTSEVLARLIGEEDLYRLAIWVKRNNPEVREMFGDRVWEGYRIYWLVRKTVEAKWRYERLFKGFLRLVICFLAISLVLSGSLFFLLAHFFRGDDHPALTEIAGAVCSLFALIPLSMLAEWIVTNSCVESLSERLADRLVRVKLKLTRLKMQI